MLRLSGASPVEEVANYTCYYIIYYSCSSNLLMKSWVNSRITVTNLPVTVWFIMFLNSIFWLMRSTAALALQSRLLLNLIVFRLCRSSSHMLDMLSNPSTLSSLYSATDLLPSLWTFTGLALSSSISHLSSSLYVRFPRPLKAWTSDLTIGLWDKLSLDICNLSNFLWRLKAVPIERVSSLLYMFIS
jgi:hypothetical protein